MNSPGDFPLGDFPLGDFPRYFPPGDLSGVFPW